MDKFVDKPPNTMGGYSRRDVDFALRHEIGHAFSATKFGNIGLDVSAVDRFQLAFRADMKQVPADIMKTLGFDVKSYGGIEYAREEVFADSFAHSTGCRTKNDYSKLIGKYFNNCRTYFGGE